MNEQKIVKPFQRKGFHVLERFENISLVFSLRNKLMSQLKKNSITQHTAFFCFNFLFSIIFHFRQCDVASARRSKVKMHYIIKRSHLFYWRKMKIFLCCQFVSNRNEIRIFYSKFFIPKTHTTNWVAILVHNTLYARDVRSVADPILLMHNSFFFFFFVSSSL